MDDWSHDEELGTKQFMRPLGDFHLRSALKIPILSDLKRGVMRRNERKAWGRITSTNLNMICTEPASQIGKLFLNIQQGLTDNASLDIDLFVQRVWERTFFLSELEFNSVEKLRNTGDDYGQLINTFREEREEGPWSRYRRARIITMAALQICLSIDSDRDISGIMESFPHTLGESKLMIIGDVLILLSGELFGIIESEDFILGEHEIILLGKTSVNIQYVDTLRMIADKVSERDNVLTACYYGSRISRTIYPTPELCIQVFILLDEGLRDIGNDFYKTIKVYEAIITGVILESKKTGFIPDDLNFLENTLKDLEPEGYYYMRRLVSMLTDHDVTYHHLCQLHGLFRLWGHPVVDPIAGVEKMRRIGKKDKIIHPMFPRLLGRKFKEKFFLSYFKKNQGTYPNCNLTQTATYIELCIRDKRKINIKDPDYNMSDWDEIMIEKTFDLPESYNLSLIVADTAISPTREELKSVEGDKRGALNPSWRRGVIKWIKDGLIDCIVLLIMINLCPTGLPLIWLIIGLYPKEREVNPVARMFSLMTLMMRAYFVITEDLLSKHILPHFPNISMTVPLLDLYKKMNSITRMQQLQKKGGRTFCINIDFEKWNLNFRREVTYDVFLHLGELFGLSNLYNRTYDIFENSLMYLSDGSYMPLFDENLKWIKNDPQNCIEGHLGGNEGLRQKGWTLGTSLMIDITCEEHGVDYKLMGQGDNQVLIITIYSDLWQLYGGEDDRTKTDIKKKLNRFLKELYLNSRLLGLPIKPLETWISDTFFAYGKLPVLEGVVGAQSLKKLARCFPFSNEDIMTLDNALGSITATFSAACNADSSSAIPFLICKFNQVLAIEWFSRYHPLGGKQIEITVPNFLQKADYKTLSTKKLKKRSVSDEVVLLAMSIIPKNFGGFNTFNLLGSHFRGIPDHITHSLVCMKLLIRELSGIKYQSDKRANQLRQVVETWMVPIFKKDPSFGLLFSDPYSLSLLAPLSTKSITGRMIRDQIKSISGSSKYALWFDELMEITESQISTDLVACMSEPEDLYPRLGYAILKGSLYGYSESVVSKVDKTVTLSRMTSTDKDVIGTIWRGEEEAWNYFYFRCRIVQTYIIPCCTREYAQLLRDFGWGKKIRGVTCPCAYEVLKREGDNLTANSNIIAVRTEVSSLLRRDNLELFNGMSIPYLGSEVEENPHFSSTRLTFGTDPLLSRPVNLLRLVNWMVPESSSWATLIKKNLSSVTDYPVENFIESDPLFSDVGDQKFEDGIKTRGSMWNHLFSLGSHISVNTQLWDDIGNKGEKIFQFQSAICLLQAELLNAIKSNIPVYQRFWVTDCHRCLTDPISTIPDLNKETVEDLVLPPKMDNPYLFIHTRNVDVIVNTRMEKLKRYTRMRLSELSKPDVVARDIVIDHYVWEFVRQVSADQKGGGVEYMAQTVEIEELKRIDISRFFLKTACLLWSNVYSEKDSYGRDLNWELDKSILIKRILSKDLENFKGGLFLFMNSITIEQLRQCEWFCPPCSYPVDIPHGLKSIKTSLILYIKRLKFSPTPRWNKYINCKQMNEIKIAYIRRFSELLSKNDYCRDCRWKIATIHWDSFEDLESLKMVKCDANHNLFPDNLIAEQAVITDGWKDIIKTCPLVLLSPPLTTHESRPNVIDLKNSFSYPMLDLNVMNKGLKSNSLHCQEHIIREYDFIPYLLIPVSIPTRAYCRIYELISQLNIISIGSGSIIVLGDGFGGSTVAMKELFAENTVYAWTLLDYATALPRSGHVSKPPSQYLFPETIVNLSNFWYGDVFDPGFSALWDIHSELIEVSLVISEIELSHYPDQEAIKKTNQMIKILLGLGKEMVVIKISVKSYTSVVEIIRAVERFPYTWELLSTPLVDFRYGEFWIALNRTKSRTGFSGSDTQLRNEVFRFAGRNKSDISYILREIDYQEAWTVIVGEDNPLRELNTRETTGWLNDVGIHDWEVDNYTGMFHQIRQFKVPERVADQWGKSKRYWFGEDGDALKLRLLAISLSKLKNVADVNRILVERSPFLIKWVKGKMRRKKKTLSYPMLCRGGKELREEEINIICKYTAIIRQFERKSRERELPKFESIGDEVNFTYMSNDCYYGRTFKKVFFRVSKNLSLSI